MSVPTHTPKVSLSPEIRLFQDASVSLCNYLNDVFELLFELQHRPNGSAQRARARLRDYIVRTGRQE